MHKDTGSDIQQHEEAFKTDNFSFKGRHGLLARFAKIGNGSCHAYHASKADFLPQLAMKETPCQNKIH